MKKVKIIFTIFALIPFLTIGQNIYSGLHGEHNHQWTLKINPDSSIFLVKNINNYGYEEYSGNISRISDTLYNIRLYLDFAQHACRAVGDSILFVSIDSTLSKTIEQVTIVYSNSDSLNTSVHEQRKITIPVNKRVSPGKSKKDYFYFTAGHKNPINNEEVKTYFKIKDEFCVELFQRSGGLITVVIQKGKLRKIGNDIVDNFTLLKQ